VFKRVSTETLAHVCARRPWTTIGVWVVIMAIAGVLVSGLLSSALTTEMESNPSLESTKGAALLEERLNGPEKFQEIVIVKSETLTVDDAAFRDKVDTVYADLLALGNSVVEGGMNYYLTGERSLVSADGHTTIMPMVLTGDYSTAVENVPQLLKVVDAANGQGGFEVLTTGSASFAHSMMQVAETDMQKAEFISMPVALIILVLVFGAVVAAVLPLGLGIVAIAVAFGAVAIIGQAYHLIFSSANMVSMLGLAVGIDYSLFIISRFREERRRGLAKLEAIRRTGATASRATFFSGTTVVLALSGLFLMPDKTFRSMAVGGIVVVAGAVFASLTILPALLSLLGDKVNALHLPFRKSNAVAHAPEHTGGFWDRVTSIVMRHPVVSLVLAVGLLLGAAAPFFDIRTGFSGISTLPDSLEAKQGYDILAKEFSVGLISPVEIVIDGAIDTEPVQAAIQRLQNALQADPILGPVHLQVNAAHDLALLTVAVPADSSSNLASDAVKRIRNQHIPEAFSGVRANVLVTGEAAASLDGTTMLNQKSPYVFGFVLALSFVFLTVVFRSLIVPLKAIVMNLLSVGAAYGLLVLVIQKGVGASLLGLQKVDTIESWLPVFLFAMLFGLSMDYHVFLISRIRERYDETHDNSEAVAFGLRSTAGIITGAAIIMVAVFSGFAMGDLVMIQQMGFGLAVAVLVDATIIRSILVPASMKLLGHWNWYLPSVLHWLPDLRAERSFRGGPQPLPVPVVSGEE